MELKLEDAAAWSEAIFGNCKLGDKRLTRRLLQIGNQLSKTQDISLSKSIEGKGALIEGSYRFIRNERVSPIQIAKGGYDATGYLAQTVPLLLAIKDSTSLSYEPSVREELGLTGTNKRAIKRGYIVHSTMLMDAEKGKTLGLIAQERWCRDEDSFGKRNKRTKTHYSVCDREADIYEYIQYKLAHNQRFVVRASHDRKLKGITEDLFQSVGNEKRLGVYTHST